MRWALKPSNPDELTAAIASARKLLENPHIPPQCPWSFGRARIGRSRGSRLRRTYCVGVDVPNDALVFVVDTVLRVSEGEVPPGPYEFEEHVL